MLGAPAPASRGWRRRLGPRRKRSSWEAAGFHQRVSLELNKPRPPGQGGARMHTSSWFATSFQDPGPSPGPEVMISACEVGRETSGGFDIRKSLDIGSYLSSSMSH